MCEVREAADAILINDEAGAIVADRHRDAAASHPRIDRDLGTLSVLSRIAHRFQRDEIESGFDRGHKAGKLSAHAEGGPGQGVKRTVEPAGCQRVREHPTRGRDEHLLCRIQL